MVPGFTLLLAGVFKLFGVYSLLSGWVILALNNFFQACTVPLVFEMAARIAGRRNALWSAWIWALFPGILQYGVRWIWEMSLSTMLFAAVLVLCMRMRGAGSLPPVRQRVRDWAGFGLLTGALAMTNPTLVIMAPVEGIWVLLSLPGWKARIRGMGLAVLSGAICFAVMAPWIIRNERVLHAFIPTRGNLGAELAMAWSPDSNGFPWGATVPTIVQAPGHKLYASMGEVAYVKMRGIQAKQWARSYPAHFWKLVSLRFYMFWAGVPHVGGSAFAEAIRAGSYCFGSITGILGLLLALRRRLPAAGLFFWAIVLLPAIYYFVTAGSRFRNPLEPILVILTVYLFQQAERRWGFSIFEDPAKRLAV